MTTPEGKKWQYWNHFIARWVVEGQGGGFGVTGPKLRKIKLIIWRDGDFWLDVVNRHGGLEVSPETMAQTNPRVYEHCAGNFWGMVYQMLTERKLVKP